MKQKTIEGTWEEVARRAEEWAGHRVRITVLDDIAFSKSSNGTHADGASSPVSNPIMGMFRDAPGPLGRGG